MNNRDNKQARKELLNYLSKFHSEELTWTQANNLVGEIMDLIEEKINNVNYYY